MLTPRVLRALVALAVVVVIVTAGYLAWSRYSERYAPTPAVDGGPGVTQVISARLAGVSKLQVAELTGTVQSSASDIRGFGWLRTDQLVKMPYSVNYVVDMGGIGPEALAWNADTRTLIVDAPDVVASAPNTDEGRRTLVQTSGLFVTRRAAEELSRRTSIKAAAAAEREARSPERMAQAREHARRAIARLLAQPLAAAGIGDARVVVTFPPERFSHDRERWDVTKSVDEVLANHR